MGARRWFTGIGAVEDGQLVFDTMQTTQGGVFGDDFDPAAVERLPGKLVLDIDCAGGTASYDSSEAGFGSGVLNVVKLTELDSLNCND